MLSEKSNVAGMLVGYPVLTLDRWLRRRQGVYEYMTEPGCLFRIQLGQAKQDLTLSDGTRIRRGDPVLKLHLWNEQMPAMRNRGPTIAWALRTSRAFHASLRALARYLRQQPDLKNVVALCAELPLGTAEQKEQLARIVARYGFETPPGSATKHRNALSRLGENAMSLLLVLATNPAAARVAVLKRDRTPVYLSRAALEHYASNAPDPPDR